MCNYCSGCELFATPLPYTARERPKGERESYSEEELCVMVVLREGAMRATKTERTNYKEFYCTVMSLYCSVVVY